MTDKIDITVKIKKPSYAKTRKRVRELILFQVDEFREEILDLYRKIIAVKEFENYTTKEVVKIIAECPNPEEVEKFRFRWGVSISLKGDEKLLYYEDVSNLKSAYLKGSDLLSSEGIVDHNKNYLIIPETFSIEEATELIGRHFKKAKGYVNFYDKETLNNSIKYFRLIRYEKIGKTEATRRVFPKLTGGKLESRRITMRNRLQDIENIINFPPDLNP